MRLFSNWARADVFPVFSLPNSIINLALVSFAGILDVGNVRLIGSVYFLLKKVNVNLRASGGININNNLLRVIGKAVQERQISKIRILIGIETNLNLIIVEHDGRTVTKRIHLTKDIRNVRNLLTLLIVSKELDGIQETRRLLLQGAIIKTNRLVDGLSCIEAVIQVTILLLYISKNNVINNLGVIRLIMKLIVEKKGSTVIVSLISLKSCCHRHNIQSVYMLILRQTH